tara:strand:- start:21773 stop:22465 length:693 start_codon:yes stop_codon:yes gene_type:complete
MPRKPIVRSNENYYHITARSNNREFFYLPILNVWDLMTRKLEDLQRKFNIKIAAFVLMNNHFHLLVLSPDEDIDRVMYFFMKDVTIDIQKASGRINKIFGGRYKGCIIENYRYLINVLKYVYRNPVEAKLCEKAEDYPYSTLFTSSKSMLTPIRVQNIIPDHAFDEYERLIFLTWVNQGFEKTESESISVGLSRSVFAYMKDRNTNKEVEPIVRHEKKKTQAQLWNDIIE